MTFTKEWLQQKISEMESRRDDPWLGLDEDDSNTLAALKLALASLETEPVAYIDPFTFKNFATFRAGETENKRMGREWAWANPDAGLVPVFTTPPAPVVPEELKYEDAVNFVAINGLANEERVTIAMRVWNACRAALLQGKAEPVSQRLGGVHAKNEPHKLIGAGDIPYGGAGDDLTSRGNGGGK